MGIRDSALTPLGIDMKRDELIRRISDLIGTLQLPASADQERAGFTTARKKAYAIPFQYILEMLVDNDPRVFQYPWWKIGVGIESDTILDRALVDSMLDIANGLRKYQDEARSEKRL